MQSVWNLLTISSMYRGNEEQSTSRELTILEFYDSGVLLLWHFICPLSIVCYYRRKFDVTEKLVRSWRR
jgi:hypothetical protein